MFDTVSEFNEHVENQGIEIFAKSKIDKEVVFSREALHTYADYRLARVIAELLLDQCIDADLFQEAMRDEMKSRIDDDDED